MIPGVSLPSNWELMPTQQQLDSVIIEGMENLKDKLIKMFTKTEKVTT